MARWSFFKRLAWCAIVAMIPSLTKAQIIDFDAAAIASDSVSDSALFHGAVALSFNFVKQLEPVNYLKTDATISYEKRKWLCVLNGRNQATFDGSEQVINTGQGNARMLYNFRKTLFPEVFAQFQWDAQRGLKERSIGGANLRINVIKKTPHQLLAAVGLFGEWELWNNTAVPEDREDEIITPTTTTVLTKLNLYLKYVFTFSEDKSAVVVRVFVQTRPDSFYRYPRISPRATLNLRLAGDFYFNTTFSGMYDFKPVVPIDNFFYSWENALVYRF